MILIGLSGKKHSGKTTLLRWIRDNALPLFGISPVDVAEWNFADPLKEMVSELFDIPRSWLWGSSEDKNRKTHLRWEPLNPLFQGRFCRKGPMTVREVLQVLGTDIIRRIDPDAWVRRLRKLIRVHNAPLNLVGDIRFPNEVEGLLQEGGYVFRLTRDPDVDLHPSETQLDPGNFPWERFTGILDNAGLSLEQTIFRLENLLKETVCQKYRK